MFIFCLKALKTVNDTDRAPRPPLPILYSATHIHNHAFTAVAPPLELPKLESKPTSFFFFPRTNARTYTHVHVHARAHAHTHTHAHTCTQIFVDPDGSLSNAALLERERREDAENPSGRTNGGRDGDGDGGEGGCGGGVPVRGEDEENQENLGCPPNQNA